MHIHIPISQVAHLQPHCSTQSGPTTHPPSSFLAIRATWLLLSSSCFKRPSLGKPSSFTMALSDRSRLSNWFCTAGGGSQVVCVVPCGVPTAARGPGGAGGACASLLRIQHSPLWHPGSLLRLFCCLHCRRDSGKTWLRSRQASSRLSLWHGPLEGPEGDHRVHLSRTPHTSQVDLIELHAVHVLWAAHDQLGR